MAQAQSRRLYFFLPFFGFFLFSVGQNLVTNGSFEIFTSCPSFLGQIGNVVGWTNPAPIGSPDYYNACASYTTSVSVPKQNAVTYQQSTNGGVAYVGIAAFNPGFPNDGREYVQTKLNDTLKKFHLYEATAFVSLLNPCNYAIRTIGLYFTPNAIQGPSTVGFIDVPNPQVLGQSTLADTLNWMMVRDTFVSQGNELYLTIGNFSYDSLSDTVYLGWRGQNHSYYYIDSVTVYDTGLMDVSEMEKAGINIFPNPNSGIFEIKYAIREETVFELRDMQGRLIEKKMLEPGTQKAVLHYESLENGVYGYSA